MDKELMLLNIVEDTPVTSQREISQRTGISLGSVNILLKKMVRDGLIKLEKIPQDRVVYMLTPAGIEEKIQKTRAYVKGHYAALEAMRCQLRDFLGAERFTEKTLGLEIEQRELLELVAQVLTGLGIRYRTKGDNTQTCDYIVSDSPEPAEAEHSRWINICDFLKP